MEAVVMVLYSVVEVHTGALADVIGRKTTIVLGKLLETIGLVWFASMDSVFDAWGANGVFMLGISFCSGSDNALLIASLKKLGYEGEGVKSEFARIAGRTQSNKFLLIAFASFFAGYLAEINVRLPLYLSIPLLFFCTILCCFFTEVQNGTKRSTQKVRNKTYNIINAVRKTVFSGCRLFLSTKTLVWIVLTLALVQISSKVWFFTYNPYFEIVGIPYRYYGYIFSALSIVSWYFSKNATRILQHVSAQGIVMSMVATIAIPMILMGMVVHPLSASLVTVQNFTRGIARPFFDSELHHLIYSEEVRATLDSVKSAVHRFLEAILLLLFRALLDTTALTTALIVVGCIVLICGSVSVCTYKRFFRK
jgi:MFS family permease